MITWRVINETSTTALVEILQRHAWNFTIYPCTTTDVALGNVPIGGGNIICDTPCSYNATNIGSVIVPCTGFNVAEVYVNGEGRFYTKIPRNITMRAVFRNANWFSLVTGGGNWSVVTEIRTFKRSNGRYNQAPIVTMLPLIRLRRLLSYRIKINVADNDFDTYRCYWSNGTRDCGGICRSALSLPASTFLNETSCVLHFTPVTVGFYAVAFTVMDFETSTSTQPLSKVPIQFIFRVWNSSNPCITPPLYIGDVTADECLFIEPGQTLNVIIRIRVMCANATLANIISVSPPGFSQTPAVPDPYDPTINTIRVNYTATASQVGQNLFCFAGVDSIGNQADSTCIRFTVQTTSNSQNSLYLANATRSPMGLVSKYQSVWTLMYPVGIQYSRPTVDAYVRFKIRSTGDDFVAYNVAKQTSNVEYLIDRLVIRSSVVFGGGQQYYVSMDPGVFLPISTCLRDSMGIMDADFWPFETPWEPSTTTETTSTTESSTTTIRNRTVPILRTYVTQTSTTRMLSTSSNRTTVERLTPSTTVELTTTGFPVGGGVGISVGILIVIGIVIALLICYLGKKRPVPVHTELDESSDTTQERELFYRVPTRRCVQPTTFPENLPNKHTTWFDAEVSDSLVKIEV